MFETLSSKAFYSFLEGYSGYNHIVVYLDDNIFKTSVENLGVQKTIVQLMQLLYHISKADKEKIGHKIVIRAQNLEFPFHLVCDANEYCNTTHIIIII